MRSIVTILLLVSNFCSSQNQLGDVFFNLVDKDQFLVDQKWSDVYEDSVSGYSWSPYTKNKKIEFVEWVWKTDFSKYWDTTKYEVRLGIIENYVKWEWIEILEEGVLIRELAFIYKPNSKILSSILDSNLD